LNINKRVNESGVLGGSSAGMVLKQGKGKKAKSAHPPKC
jgi:hypothetical protein